jgi:hypothetical protein
MATEIDAEISPTDSEGGLASSQTNGGTIEMGDVNSGNNTGNVIEVGL